MNYQHILFSVEQQVATITLNRPDVLNSFNKPMGLELRQALEKCGSDRDIRAVVITGAGRAFCAGQDLAEAITPGMEIKSIVDETYNPIVKAIRSLEKPVICLVNGVAAGAGANIAFCCDITLAAESANFIQSFSKIGLIPDSGGTFFLPRLIGHQRASALMMLGDKLPAAQAVAWGLIWQAVPDDQLQAEGQKMAKKLAAMPTRGLGLTKKAMNAGFFNTFEDQLETEGTLQEAAGKTYDYKEGVNAFLEKRQPVYKGE